MPTNLWLRIYFEKNLYYLSNCAPNFYPANDGQNSFVQFIIFQRFIKLFDKLSLRDFSDLSRVTWNLSNLDFCPQFRGSSDVSARFQAELWETFDFQTNIRKLTYKILLEHLLLQIYSINKGRIAVTKMCKSLCIEKPPLRVQNCTFLRLQMIWCAVYTARLITAQHFKSWRMQHSFCIRTRSCRSFMKSSEFVAAVFYYYKIYIFTASRHVLFLCAFYWIPTNFNNVFLQPSSNAK